MHDRPVFNEFDEAHIDRVWALLQEIFHFNVAEWKSEFADYLSKQPRRTEEASAFLMFGSQHINPILNSILRRKTGHPTWNKLINHVIRTNPRRRTQDRTTPKH